MKHPVFIDVGGQVADERNGKTQTQKKKRESETFHALIVTRICFLLVKNRLRKSKEAGEKVSFLSWNTERRRSICAGFCPAFLNTVLFNWSGRNLIQIYGQGANFWWFVRKQNAFYGQTGIFQWFVRNFLTIMMRIYGQTAIFAHFVRNRHFSSRPFTDKASIFIDVSVNDNDFAKCSAR